MVSAEVLRLFFIRDALRCALRISKEISKTQIEKNNNSNSCWTTCIWHAHLGFISLCLIWFLPPICKNQRFCQRSELIAAMNCPMIWSRLKKHPAPSLMQKLRFHPSQQPSFFDLCEFLFEIRCSRGCTSWPIWPQKHRIIHPFWRVFIDFFH